jgi:hypothetical protein
MMTIFFRWIDQRLDSTFGPRQSKGPTGHNNRGGMALVTHDLAQVSAIMASEVGKGIGPGTTGSGTLTQGGTKYWWGVR